MVKPPASSLEPASVPPARGWMPPSFLRKLCLISDQIWKEKGSPNNTSVEPDKQCTHSGSLRWWCSSPGGCWLWSGRWRGAAGRTYWWSRGTAGDALCGLEEQKSHSERPVSAVDPADPGRKGWEPPQLLHTWPFYSAPTAIWADFRSCYGYRSPQEDFFVMWKCCVSAWFCLGESAAPQRTKQRPDCCAPLTQEERPPESEFNLIMGAQLRRDNKLMLKWRQCGVISHRRRRTLVKWCRQTVWKSLHPIL